MFIAFMGLQKMYFDGKEETDNLQGNEKGLKKYSK